MQLTLFLGEARFPGLTCDLGKALASSGNDLFTPREGRAGFHTRTSLVAASEVMKSAGVTRRFLGKPLYVVLLFKIWGSNVVFIIPQGNEEVKPAKEKGQSGDALFTPGKLLHFSVLCEMINGLVVFKLWETNETITCLYFKQIHYSR